MSLTAGTKSTYEIRSTYSNYQAHCTLQLLVECRQEYSLCVWPQSAIDHCAASKHWKYKVNA
jgi:hypothetical protein